MVCLWSFEDLKVCMFDVINKCQLEAMQTEEERQAVTHGAYLYLKSELFSKTIDRVVFWSMSHTCRCRSMHNIAHYGWRLLCCCDLRLL